MNQGGSETRNEFVRVEDLTDLTMKNTSFWGMTPCSLVEVYRYSGGMY
jgi:hypothetical protein